MVGFGDWSLSRRRFGTLMVVTGASVGALSRVQRVVASVLSNSRGTRVVYVFDPTAEGVTGSGCATCVACRRHASHKVFASRAIADTRRAHPHCRCAITTRQIAAAEYQSMFGPSRRVVELANLGEFDHRWAGKQI